MQPGEVTTETIKAAFKAQAMQAHPDRVMAPGTPPEVQQQAVVKFQKLQVGGGGGCTVPYLKSYVRLTCHQNQGRMLLSKVLRICFQSSQPAT